MHDCARTWHEKAMAAPLDQRSRELRQAIVRTMFEGGRGHLGSSLSLVEMLRVLYDHVLRFRPDDPKWAGRDRCILSKGHGCLALYVLLAEKGFFAPAALDGFCRLGGMLGGHPDGCKVPGVDASTGSLGHGLSMGLGMALALRMERSPARTFVVLGDGECNEGSVWEAAMCAGKHGLDSLSVLVDYNKYQSYDATCVVQELEPFAAKWESFGCAVREVNGHDVDELRAVLAGLPLAGGRPSVVICHTVKGKGVGFAENNLEWHHRTKLGPDEYRDILKNLGASHA